MAAARIGYCEHVDGKNAILAQRERDKSDYILTSSSNDTYTLVIRIF